MIDPRLQPGTDEPAMPVTQWEAGEVTNMKTLPDNPQRVVSWRLLKSGGVAHAVREPRFHPTMWTAVCGIGGHDGGESNSDKCKNCIRKLKPKDSTETVPSAPKTSP
jgi:hypothetical protein